MCRRCEGISRRDEGRRPARLGTAAGAQERQEQQWAACLEDGAPQVGHPQRQPRRRCEQRGRAAQARQRRACEKGARGGRGAEQDVEPTVPHDASEVDERRRAIGQPRRPGRLLHRRHRRHELGRPAAQREQRDAQRAQRRAPAPRKKAGAGQPGGSAFVFGHVCPSLAPARRDSLAGYTRNGKAGACGVAICSRRILLRFVGHRAHERNARAGGRGYAAHVSPRRPCARRGGALPASPAPAPAHACEAPSDTPQYRKSFMGPGPCVRGSLARGPAHASPLRPGAPNASGP